MYIYFNLRDRKLRIDSCVIYKENELIICGDGGKVYSFDVGGGKRVFIYGEVYYFIGLDGKIKYLDTNDKENLSDIFSRFKVEEIVKRLEGIYVGIIVERDGKVIIFQDKHSRQDLFYARESEGWCFATDLEPVVKFVKKLEYDQMGLYSFLQLNYTPKKHTIYKNINRLGVNEIVWWNGRDMEFKDIEVKPVEISEYGENDLERYWEIFQDSIYSRATKKGENWVNVSGGWDSSFMLATLLKEFSSKKVIPVIGVMDYSKKTGPYNPYEVEKVKKISKIYGLKPEVVVWDFASSSGVRYLEEIKEDLKKHHLYYFGAPGAYLFGERVNKSKAKENVLFNGMIADSVHNFGYAQFITVIHDILSFSEYVDKMNCYLYGPHFFNKVMNNTFKDDFVYKFFKSLYKNVSLNDESCRNKMTLLERYVLPFIFGSPRIPFVEMFSSEVFSSSGKREFIKWLSDEYLLLFYKGVKPETLYYWLLYCYNNFHFQGYGGKQWRLGAEYYGISGRDPYFDMRLIDFCSAMPEEWGRGLNFNRVKYPLKWAMEKKLKFPVEIIENPPHSYIMETDKNVRTPTGQLLYESAFVSYFKDTIKTKNYKEILDERYFNFKFIDKLLKDYRDGKEVGANENFLRCLLSLLTVGYY